MSALGVWKQTFKTLLSNRIILLPFVIIGLINSIVLSLIFLAPQPPFSYLLAPPIRVFWGDKFLHYPVNFILIPKLFNYAHIFTSATIGVLMAALAIGMLKEAKSGNKPQMLINLIYALKRFFALFSVWLITFIIAAGVYRIPTLFSGIVDSSIFKILFFISYFIVALVEVAFIYAPPAIIIEKKGIISGIKQGLLFTKRKFLTTLLLVMIPAILYLPLLVLRTKSAVLMNQFFPEITLIVLGLGIIGSVIINCLIICSTTTLFLNQREN